MIACHELDLVKGFYDELASAELYQRLFQEQNWPDNSYVVAGRQFTLPRLQTWHADPGIFYSYSNNLLQTRPWTPLLSSIREKVQLYLNVEFNSVLVNLYRDGNDFVDWHTDDELELGAEPFIASVTFGAERSFVYRHKSTAETGQLLLPSGALLVMGPSFLNHWLHSLPRDNRVVKGRINLTFRKVVPVESTFKENPGGI